ncbi:GNAT family N-acetyltransferase [Flexivirga alba]|jgi:Acetyltransferases, including N-acetylases of ribosomal proteins|uniref:GNAT family N-acetyltransferase n=1 Tax=Flexivirga alba TaxID=702742 RepID=A0ABW2ABI5_9MICO
MTGLASDTRLELLSMQHHRVLEDFERDNREFFARQIGDRGDDFFAHFAEQLAERVAENDSGQSLFFVVVGASGDILARINLIDIDDPERTELGYRVAESAQGRGVATGGVRAALSEADARGVRTVRARVSTANLASQRVLEHCGFGCEGPVDAPVGVDKEFVGYRKIL